MKLRVALVFGGKSTEHEVSIISALQAYQSVNRDKYDATCVYMTKDGETLESYEADVDTDADYTPDHEVISDGYFHESSEGFRSAPYFDVQIDGITLLDTQF